MDEVVAYTQTVAGVTKRYYPHYNHLYSVAALTDGTIGAVVERFTYDAYGKQKITDASGNVTRAKSSVGWDRGFTGYITDNETGLLHARARQYSPTLGRFVSRDHFKYVDGFSMYAAYFVPGRLDPTGNWSCDPSCGQQVDGLVAKGVIDKSSLSREVALLKCENWKKANCSNYGDFNTGSSCEAQCADKVSKGIGTMSGCLNKCHENIDSQFSDCYNQTPTSDTAGCAKWAGKRFMGANAQCVCECAGDSGWDNYVRACLACMNKKGETGTWAHDLCYKHADAKYGVGSGWAARVDIVTRCCYCWAK